MTRSEFDAHNGLQIAAKTPAWALPGKGHKTPKKSILARLFGL